MKFDFIDRTTGDDIVAATVEIGPDLKAVWTGLYANEARKAIETFHGGAYLGDRTFDVNSKADWENLPNIINSSYFFAVPAE